MAETITQNGSIEACAGAITTLRTSVGEFIFRSAPISCRLEVKIGKIRRLLKVFETDEAAVLAVRNRHTGFHPWDTMGRNAVAIQIDTPERWGRKGGPR